MEIGTAKANAAPGTENLNDPAYLKIRDTIYQASGIYHPQEKLYLIASRCSRRMTELKVHTPAEYLQILTNSASRQAEMRLLLNEITIGETYMFRSPSQLEALRNVILPQFAKSKSAMGFKRLRIWSAGCSTGEEPYTLAMFLLEESQKLLAGWSLEILATDLNDRSIATAKEGIYGEYSLRNTSEPLRRKYFTPHGDKLKASDQLKSIIRFDRVNLGDDSKMTFLKGMDVIFCCNVLIYFDTASKRKVLQHFFSNLLPGGYFFLGHAESLYQVDERFQLVHFPGTIGYWKPIPGGKP